MPTQAFGVYAAEKDTGTEVSSTYEGRHVTLYESELVHPVHADGFVDKGDPVVFGTVGKQGVGVSFLSAAAATDLVALDTEGIWNLSVVAAEDAGNCVVYGGDPLFINTSTCVISKIRDNATQIPYGYALGQVESGATAVIAVKVHWDPKSHWLLDDEKLYFGDAFDVYAVWDNSNTRLHIVGAAAETVFQFGTTDKAAQIKIHARPTTLGSALEIRCRTVSNTPATNAIDSIMYFQPAAAMTAGYNSSAGFFQSRLDATFSMTDGYLQGIHVEVANQGTINGGGVIVCAINATVPAAGGVFTALSVYTPLWLDWKATEVVSAGICTMAFISNNGTTPLDSIFYILAGSTVTNLFNLSETGSMVSAETTADYTFTTYVKIKVVHNGVTYYLIADRP